MSNREDELIDIEIATEGTKTLELVSSETQKLRKTQLQVLQDISEDYSEIQLTEEEEKRVGRTLRKMKTGSSTYSLMRCGGADCKLAGWCDLVQIGHGRHGKAPVGKQCPYEMALYAEAVQSHMEHFEVDPNNFTEWKMVTELAQIDVINWRFNMELSLPENASMTVEQTVGVDPRTGDPITQQQINPIFEAQQKLKRRESQLTKLMVGDRQEKYKKEAALKQKSEDDASSQMAQLRKSLSSLQKQVSEVEIQDAKIVTPEDLINGEHQED